MNNLRKILLDHPKTVLSSGVILLVAAGLFGLSLFGLLTTDDEIFFASGTSSQEVNQTLKDKFGVSEKSAVLLFESKDEKHKVASPEYGAEVQRLLGKIPGAKSTTYYQTGSEQFVSKDGYDTYAVVNFDEKDSKKNYETVASAMNNMSSDTLKVSAGGMLMGAEQTQEQAKIDLTMAELISLPLLALLLFFFFRSPIATSIPLVMSLLTIAGALAIARLVHMFMPVDTYTLNVITILGVGLSVDYSLLSVNRFREELSNGKSVREAAEMTIKTSSRTVLFSGLTVIVCLLALLLFPIGFMQAVSIGGAAAVIVAVLISTLLIPPALVVIGKNIDKWAIKRRSTRKKNGWQSVAENVTKRPVAALLFGVLVIGLFVWPLKEVKPTTFGWRTLASNSSSYYVGKQMEENFELKSPSLTAVVDFGHKPTVSELCQLSSKISSYQQVDNVLGAYALAPEMDCATVAQASAYGMLPPQVVVMADQYVKDNTAKIDIVTHGEAGSTEVNGLIKELRGTDFEGKSIGVAGIAALSHDTHEAYAKWTPIALGVIAVAMIILLSILLGSLVIPVQAIIINSLALFISLGVIVMLFQFGWGTNILHHTPMLGLEPAIPILIGVIAFGLSMDYAVFLYSRMHEIYEKTGDSQKSIVEGVAKTGPIITAAAVVLFVVVAAFATSRISIMQQIGIGLSIAVLVDAFFVRIFFVPAVMELFGKKSWWAPKWLKKFVIRHE